MNSDKYSCMSGTPRYVPGVPPQQESTYKAIADINSPIGYQVASLGSASEQHRKKAITYGTWLLLSGEEFFKSSQFNFRFLYPLSNELQ